MRNAILAMLVAAIALQGCDTRNAPPAQPDERPATSVTEPDYQRARYSELHFKPDIDQATDGQCLTCHAEVLETTVREQSPAGVKAAETLAWYQQTSTYQGTQETFHRRHISTPLAKELMNLRCNSCHQGNNPRDEAPETSADSQNFGYTLRKHVDVETVCLKCHGQMNWQVMGLPAPWLESKEMFQNNCLICHAGIRTQRHRVNYLNAAAIEKAGEKSGDACFGCHGGRAWYRMSYPYPRHPWPGMSEETPAWATQRPTESEARFLTETTIDTTEEK